MAYVALPQGAIFLRKFPSCPKPRFSRCYPGPERILARSGSCPVRHEGETWPEIRADLREPGQAFAAIGEAENVSISCCIQQRGVILRGSADGWERERGALRRARRRSPAISAAKGRSGPEVPPTNQGRNHRGTSKPRFFRAGGSAILRWWKPDASWPKAKSRTAGRQLSTCGAAGTSTLASITSWAC
jgi:hypothetical protein